MVTMITMPFKIATKNDNNDDQDGNNDIKSITTKMSTITILTFMTKLATKRMITIMTKMAKTKMMTGKRRQKINDNNSCK